jgi:hypothetical protein
MAQYTIHEQVIFPFKQDAEKVHQRRSRLAQRLTVLPEYDSPRDTGRSPGHGRLTVSAAFTNVTRFIQRVVNLAPVRERDAHSSSRRGPRWALPGTKARLARKGLGG